MKYFPWPVFSSRAIILFIFVGMVSVVLIFAIPSGVFSKEKTKLEGGDVKTQTQLLRAVHNQAKKALEQSPDQAAKAEKVTEKTLLAIAKQRKEMMRDLAHEDPQAFLRNALSKEEVSSFTSAVQAELEQAATLEGVVEVYHVDDFENHENSKFIYKLKKQGKKIEVIPSGDDLNLVSGAFIKVAGVAMDDFVVAYDGEAGMTVTAAAPPPASVGDQKTLVIPVAPVGVNTFLTSAQMHDLIFNGPFQSFYGEQSGNKVSFSGKVTDWIRLSPYPSGDCGDFWDLNRPEVKNYLLKAGIDPSQYRRILILPYNGFTGCSIVGMGTLEFNGKEFQASFAESYFKPTAGTYSLYADEVLVTSTKTVLEKAFLSCRSYAAQNPTKTVRCDWLSTQKGDSLRQIYNSKLSLTENNQQLWVVLRTTFPWHETMSHEIGHSLGVLHANALTCWGTTYYKDCHHDEYANGFDVMGIRLYSKHFNAAYKYQLGWLDDTSVQSVNTSGVYSIAPIESSAGVRALKITNPAVVGNGNGSMPLYVELRQPIGFDKVLDPALAGLAINQLIEPCFGCYSFTRLLNANQRVTEGRRDPTLMPGSNFAYPSHGITISGLTIATGTSARFKVGVTAPECRRYLHSVSDPEWNNFKMSPGNSAWYGFTITNNDWPACSGSEYTVTALLSNAAGAQITTSTYLDTAVVAPGLETGGAVAVKSSPDTPPGVYTATIIVRDIKNSRVVRTIKDFIVYSNPVIETISPAVGVAGSEVTLSGVGFDTDMTVFISGAYGFAYVKPDYDSSSNTSVTFTFPTEIFTTSVEYGDMVSTPADTYNVMVVRNTDGGESNTVEFQVTGNSLGVLNQLKSALGELSKLLSSMTTVVQAGAARLWGE